MVDLKCGCKVEDDGSFVLGEPCKEKNCTECQLLEEGLHPFGKKRFKFNIG